MTTQTRPNFFILLGLHPDVSWNQVTFERTLRQKRGEWSRQSAGVAKKALAAKQHLALIPTIIEIMTTPELREKEAKAARKELTTDRQAQIERFEKQLALLNARDTVTQKEIDQFTSTFQSLVPPDEVRQRITVPLAVSAGHPAAKEAALEPSLLKSISEHLHILHMETLYELLQYNQKTARPELLRAVDVLYSRAVRLPPSAEAIAQIELAGLARQVFQSNETRAAYDESLSLASLSLLFQELDTSLNHSINKDLHPNQVLLFLQNAAKNGWQAHEALEKLKEHARQKQWAVVIPALDLETEKLLCPNCATVNDKNQHYCATCAQALSINCPRCKKQLTCEAAACDTCGFAIGNRYLTDRLLEELAGLFKAGDLQQAWRVVSEAEASWCLGHDQQDSRSQQIIAYKAQIRRQLAAQKQALKDALEGLYQLDLGEVVIEKQRFIQIMWFQPKEGQIVILKSSQPLQRQGQALPERELDQLGTRLTNIHLEDYALDPWESEAMIYYSPVILLYQQAYIGPSQRYVCIENVSQPGYQNLGSVIRLHWTWPPACQEVLLSYHTAQQSWNPETGATSLRLSRAEYDRLGYYEIRDTAHQDYHITIAAIMMLGDEQVVSQGIHLFARTTRKIVIAYEIRPPTLLHKKRQAHLLIDPPALLPTLLFISQQGRLPLNKTDGELFYRIEAAETESRKIIIDLPDRSFSPKTFGKLFFEDNTKYHEFTVHHPSRNQMRLS